LRALTTNEVALPVLNTFELFSRLAPKRLAVDAPAMIPVDAIIADSVRGEPDLGVVASIDDARSRLTIVTWNYHDVAGGYADRRDIRVTLVGLPRGSHRGRAVEYSIDEVSGNAYTAWLAMGSPQSPAADQVAKLRAAAGMRAVARDLTSTLTGDLQLDLSLPRQSVKLIEIELAPK
jgi:xylan 1,4-beta-xylosidase